MQHYLLFPGVTVFITANIRTKFRQIDTMHVRRYPNEGLISSGRRVPILKYCLNIWLNKSFRARTKEHKISIRTSAETHELTESHFVFIVPIAGMQCKLRYQGKVIGSYQ